MPQIELASLSGQELRRLLAAAEQREHRGLAEQLRAELLARKGRVTAMVAGPMRVPTPPPLLETEDTPAAPRRLKPALLAVVATAVMAIGLGWGVAQAPGTPATSAPALPPPATAPPVPAPAPQPVAQSPAPVATPITQSVRTKPKAAPRPAAPCRSNRTICASPRLMAQERRMRQAYERALANGANPLAVDEAQARWRTDLARTKSRERAARLYEWRIHELEAISRQASR